MAGPIAEAFVELRIDDGKVVADAQSAMSKVESKGKAAAAGVEQSFTNAASQIESEFNSAASGIESEFESLGSDSAGSFSTGFGDVGGGLGDSILGALGPKLLGAAGVASIGALAGVALSQGISGAMAREDLAAGLQVSLGLTEDEAERAGEIAGGLYRDGWGVGLDETGAAVEAALASFPGLTDTELADITEEALAIAQAFDIDVSQAISAAGQAVESGLAGTGGEALDQFVVGLRDMPVALREELFEASNEYGKFFDQLGITGDEAFAALSEAADGGIFGIDKTGDAIKEFTIRATDGSDASKEAFEAIGLDADAMAEAVLAGGDDAREAFDDIIDGLESMEDPAAQAQAAIALFGTPLEDLGTGQIPDFLADLSAMQEGFSDTEGAAEGIADTLSGTTSQKFEAFKREALGTLVDFFVEHVIPTVQEVVAWFRDDLAPRMQELYDKWKPAIDLVIEYFMYLWAQIQVIWEGIVGVFDFFIALLSGDWAAAWEAIKQVFTATWEFIQNWLALAWQAITTLVGGALDAIWNLISGAFTAITGLFTSVWEGISSFFSGIWETLTGYVDTATAGIKLAIETVWNEIAGVFEDVWNGVSSFFSGIWEDLAGFVETGINEVVDFVTELPGRIADAVAGAFDAIYDNFKDVVNSVIDAWNGLSLPGFTIGGWDPPGPGPKFPALTIPSISVPQIPRLADGGIVTGPTLALIGDNASGKEAVLPLERATEFGFAGGGAAVNIQEANFYDGTDADLVAFKTMRALRARSLTAA